jgi:ADP-ribose pyrophosphatase YjhB (NUDIX family)
VSPTPQEQDQVAGLPRHVVGVAAVVVDGAGRALLVRRRVPPRWELPGGALEVGETVTQGLVREVAEETGLTVRPRRLSGVYQNMTLGPVALVFVCERLAGSERTSDETSQWRWVTRGDLDDLMPPAWAVRVTDALDAWRAMASTEPTQPAPSVPVRVHDGERLL